MATKEEVRDKVLRKLTVLAKGQTAKAEDASLVESHISSIHSNLLAKGKIYWPVDNTPEEAVNAFVWIVANECKTEFGITNPELPLKSQQATTDIAELNAVAYEGEPNEGQYF